MQADKTLNRTSLTLFNPADRTILGELADAEWLEENSPQGTNYVLSGLAGDGTLNSLELFIDNGMDTVEFEYWDGVATFKGNAFLLKPSKAQESSGTNVRIETPTMPLRV